MLTALASIAADGFSMNSAFDHLSVVADIAVDAAPGIGTAKQYGKVGILLRQYLLGREAGHESLRLMEKLYHAAFDYLIDQRMEESARLRRSAFTMLNHEVPPPTVKMKVAQEMNCVCQAEQELLDLKARAKQAFEDRDRYLFRIAELKDKKRYWLNKANSAINRDPKTPAFDYEEKNSELKSKITSSQAEAALKDRMKVNEDLEEEIRREGKEPPAGPGKQAPEDEAKKANFAYKVYDHTESLEKMLSDIKQEQMCKLFRANSQPGDPIQPQKKNR